MADSADDMLEQSVKETETDLLKGAFGEQPKETVAEPPVEEAKPAEQPRDEQGKFAPKEAAKEEPKAETPPVEAKQESEALVPSWRLREVAEEKRAAEARAATLEAQTRQLNERLAALERPKQQPQEEIDPLLDPQGFAKRLESQFDARLREERLNNNLALAHVRHGDKFEKAFNAILAEKQAGNQQLVYSLASSANPGEAIVKWYSDQQTLREVGGDPASYRQKLLDEALKDPAYLARAIEAAKASAGGAPRQNNITQMPPSLSRATGSAANEAEDLDNSDAAIFKSAFR